MKKLALFDFCETLVSFQTADAFVDFVREKEGKSFMIRIHFFNKLFSKLKIIALFNKFLPGFQFAKKLKLLQLRGFHFEKLDNLAKEFYTESVKPNLIEPLVEEMNKKAHENYEICIVSAGYSIYLKYFARDFNISHLLATNIAFAKKNNLCRGQFSGNDCYGIEKVKRIKEYFKNQDIHFEESIAYSDSDSDLPMMELTGRAVVVSRLKSQAWSKIKNFDEIIWN